MAEVGKVKKSSRMPDGCIRLLYSLLFYFIGRKTNNTIFEKTLCQANWADQLDICLK